MARLERRNVVMCYDGSLEGFLSLVFCAYAQHVLPDAIAEQSCVQPALGQTVLDTECDLTLAERVKVGICNHAGYGTYRNVERAFLSCVPGRENALMEYIVRAMDGGRRAVADPSNPNVAAVERMVLSVGNELEDMYQFVRFQLLENGVYFSKINPKADLVGLMMGHFVERFNTQAFVIYDEVHHVAGVYDMRKSYLVRTDEITIPGNAAGDMEYQRLWKLFYDSVSNEQRFNPGLRRQNLPKRFWRNLTEMQLAVSSEANARA